MKSIAIDMDNVIVDVESHYINWYEAQYGIRVSRSALLGMPETEGFPDKEAVRRFLYTPGFFRTAPIINGAQQAVKKLMEGYRVYIVSAAMEFPNSLLEKYEWLGEHLPFISWKQIVLCGDKCVIGTDYMVDDHVKNLDSFGGKGLLYTACHNVNIMRHLRMDNWAHVLQFFSAEQP